MRKIVSLLFILLIAFAGNSQRVRKKDRKRDVEMVTTAGVIRLRLYDVTPQHRDNFLRLVKSHFYDSLLFHRVIPGFMIQGGDPQSRRAEKGAPLGNGGPAYTVPAEFRPELFHRRGVLAAARQGDAQNPLKASSSCQFYIVQGRVFNDAQMDSIETVRLKGYKLPEAHRQIYRTTGGTPQLDQNYTIFGEVIEGIDVVDAIAAAATSKGSDRDRPLDDIRIIRARLVKRKKV